MHTVRRKRNKTAPDRLEYLGLLVTELQEATSKDAKKQILANLANFAYDPYNYKYFQQLGVIDIFLRHLTDIDESLVEFSIGGVCNLCLDPINKQYILESNGVKIISSLLEQNNENILLSAITTLMFLVTPQSKCDVTNAGIKHMIKLKSGQNKRLKNLAEIFLQDYCSSQDVDLAQKLLQNPLEDIPLPNT